MINPSTPLPAQASAWLATFIDVLPYFACVPRHSLISRYETVGGSRLTAALASRTTDYPGNDGSTQMERF